MSARYIEVGGMEQFTNTCCLQIMALLFLVIVCTLSLSILITLSMLLKDDISWEGEQHGSVDKIFISRNRGSLSECLEKDIIFFDWSLNLTIV